MVAKQRPLPKCLFASDVFVGVAVVAAKLPNNDMKTFEKLELGI